MARLGGPTQAQISAAGDTVNVASRLEKLTRAHGAVIAVSEAVVAAVRKSGRSDLLEGFESIAAQTIRGRVGRLSVWIRRRVQPRTG
jgi:adenylate cyclase